MTNHKMQGKKNREAGKRFEIRVRADLESKGWVVDRWTNTIEITYIKEYGTGNPLSLMKLVSAKPKYNPFTKRLMMASGGFPDFVVWAKPNNVKLYGEPVIHPHIIPIGVECKTNGYLNKIEREKCQWLLKNNIFSKILVAKKGEKRGEIIYKEAKNGISKTMQ